MIRSCRVFQKHPCTALGGCTCNPDRTEPRGSCPYHGHPDFRKCVYCGKYMPKENLQRDRLKLGNTVNTANLDIPENWQSNPGKVEAYT